MTRSQRTEIGFFSLPAELRIEIYKLCGSAAYTLGTECGLFEAYAHKVPVHLLEVSKKINTEAQEYIKPALQTWRECTWTVDLDPFIAGSQLDGLVALDAALQALQAHLTDVDASNMAFLKISTLALMEIETFSFTFPRIGNMQTDPDVRFPWGAAGWSADTRIAFTRALELSQVLLKPWALFHQRRNAEGRYRKGWNVEEVCELVRISRQKTAETHHYRPYSETEQLAFVRHQAIV